MGVIYKLRYITLLFVFLPYLYKSPHLLKSHFAFSQQFVFFSQKSKL